MFAKGTPSKAQRRAAEFQRTPLPRPRRAAHCCSPLLWDQGTPHSGTPHPASPSARPSSTSLPSWCPSPPGLPGSTPHGFCTSPSKCGVGALSPSAKQCATPALGSKHMVLSLPPVASTPTGAISTPSKIITISTPLRPCSRQKAMEMQDDIKAAVEEQSVALLRVALQRRHPCPGEHTLHEAIRQAHVPAVRLLLQGHAEPNARCLCLERGCEFPLQLAVSGTNFLRASDRYQAAELLLRAGARPSQRRGDAEANTPLHDAVRRGDLDVVNLLLRYMADPNAQNGCGLTPLHLVLRPGGGDFVPATTSRAMAEALLEAGSRPLSPEEMGTPLVACIADPELRALLARWAAWWRCRMLAWIRSRGKDHPLCHMLPELLVNVARFL